MKKVSVFLLAIFFISAAAPCFAADRKSVRAHIERGKRYYAVKDYPGAIEAWNKALEEEPLNKEAASLIEEARTKADFQAVTDKRLTDESQETLKRAFESGVAYYNRGEYDKAVSEWEKVVASMPNNEALKRQIAELRQIDNAPVPADKDDAAALARLSGELQSVLGPAIEKVRARSEDLRFASEKRRKNAAEAIERGKNLFGESKHDEALSAWRDALALLPANPQAATLLGGLEIEVKDLRASSAADPGEANRLLQSALESASASLHAKIEGRRRSETEGARAASVFRDAVLRGDALFQRGEYGEAARTWREAVSKLGPSDSVEPSRNLASLEAQIQALKTPSSVTSGPDAGETSRLLKSALESASASVNSKIEARRRAEADQAKEAAALRDAVHRGELSFESGDFGEAARAWREAVSKLDAPLSAAAIENLTLFETQLQALRAPATVTDIEETGRLLKSSLERASSVTQSKIEARRQSEEARAKEAAAFRDAVRRGNASFERGDTGAAAGAWHEAVSMLAAPQNAQAVQSLAALDAQINDLHAPLAAAGPDVAETNFLLKSALERATLVVQSKIQDRRRSENESEKEAAALRDAVRRGDALFERGDYAAAARVWREAVSKLAGPQNADAVKSLDAFEAQTEIFRTASVPVDETALQASNLELRNVLGRSLETVRSKIQERHRADEERRAAETALRAALENGKALFAEGKFEEAARAWSEASALLPEKAEIGKLLISLETEAGTLRELSGVRSADVDEAGRALRTAVENASAAIRSKADAKRRANQSFSEGAATVRTAVEQGNTLFGLGRHEEAAQVWREALPLVPGKTDAERLLGYIEVEAAMLRQPSQEEAATRETGQIFRTALEKASVSVREQVDKRHDAEAEHLKQMAVVNAAIERGNTFFAQGKHDEAIHAWREALPYLPDAAAFADTLKALESGMAALRSGPAADEKTDLQEAERTFRGMLESATQAVGLKVEELRRAEESRTRDISAVLLAIQRGTALHREGRYEEAIQTWRQAIPLLPEKEGAQKMLAALESATASLRAFPVGSTEKDMLQAGKTFRDTLGQASAGIGTRTEELRTAETLRQRDADAVRAAIGEGQALYDQGKYEEAVLAWRKAVMRLPETEKTTALLDSLETDTAAYRQAPKDSGQLRDTATAYQTVLERASAGIHAKTEKVYAADQNRVRAATAILTSTKQGTQLFSQDRYEEAIRVWREALPNMSDTETSQKLLDSLQADTVEFRSLALKRPSEGGDVGAASDAFRETLSRAAAEVRQKADAISQTEEVRLKEASEKRTRAREAVARGQALYDAGKADEAIKEWRASLPGFKDGQAVGLLLDDLERSQRGLDAARATAAKSSDENTAEPPPAFIETLKKAAATAAARTVEVRASAETAAKAAEQKRLRNQEIFLNGKKLSDEGRHQEAAALWESLAANTKDEVTIKGLLINYRDAADDLQKARDSAATVSGPGVSLPPAPGDLLAILEQSGQRFRQEAARLGGVHDEFAHSEAEKESFVQKKIAEGRQAYDAGKWSEALTAWEALVPYLQDGVVLQKAIADMRDALSAREAAQRAATAPPKTPAFPDEFKRYLEERTKSIKQNAEAIRKASDEAVEAIRSRQDFTSALAEGKKLADEGDWPGALAVWKAAQGRHPESPEFRDTVQRLEEAYKASLKPLPVAPSGRTAASGKTDNMSLVFAEVEQIQKRYGVPSSEIKR